MLNTPSEESPSPLFFWRKKIVFGQISTALYFSYFAFIVPGTSLIENILIYSLQHIRFNLLKPELLFWIIFAALIVIVLAAVLLSFVELNELIPDRLNAGFGLIGDGILILNVHV